MRKRMELYNMTEPEIQHKFNAKMFDEIARIDQITNNQIDALLCVLSCQPGLNIFSSAVVAQYLSIIYQVNFWPDNA